MEFQLNEILDLIEGDMKSNCNKNMGTCKGCKYELLHKDMNCFQFKNAISDIRKLAEVCFEY